MGVFFKKKRDLIFIRFNISSLLSSDFYLKQRNVPSLRRLRGWGCSTRKTIQTTSTSLGDARAPNRNTRAVDPAWPSSSSILVYIRRQNLGWPDWPVKTSFTISTIQTGQVRRLPAGSYRRQQESSTNIKPMYLDLHLVAGSSIGYNPFLLYYFR